MEAVPVAAQGQGRAQPVFRIQSEILLHGRAALGEHARRADDPRPVEDFRHTPALVGGLYTEKHGRLREYGNKVFDLFFKRELAADEADAIAGVIASIGLSDADYHAYLAGEGATAYERAQEEAVSDRVFGVPLFYFENEPFWGYDRMGLLEQRLTEAGLKREEPLRRAM
jgi:hypothetical protein